MRAIVFCCIFCLPPLLSQAQPLAPLFEEAYRMEKAKRYDEAILAYTLILKIDDRSADAYLNRGLCHFKKESYDEALKDLKKASELLPDNMDVVQKIGDAYYNQGEYKPALKHYDQVLLRQPSNAVAYNSRGMSHQQLGDLRQALNDYNMAIQYDPKMAAAYNNRGAVTYYNQGTAKAHRLDIESAIKDFTTAIELNPLFCMAYKNRALAYSFLEKYDEAGKDAASAVNCASNSADNWLAKGSIEIKSGRYAVAISDLYKAIELSEDQPEAYFLLSEAYMLSGDYDEAEATVNSLVEKYKFYKSPATYRLAQIYGYRQNKEMAIEYLEKANSMGYFKEKDQVDKFLKEPAFESFRRDPDFKKTVTKIKK